MNKYSYEKEAKTIMKALANKNRFNIMTLILDSKKDLCVSEISEALNISQSATSHQLSYLEAVGIIKCVPKGKMKCYIPTDEAITKKVKKIITILI